MQCILCVHVHECHSIFLFFTFITVSTPFSIYMLPLPIGFLDGVFSCFGLVYGFVWFGINNGSEILIWVIFRYIVALTYFD